MLQWAGSGLFGLFCSAPFERARIGSLVLAAPAVRRCDGGAARIEGGSTGVALGTGLEAAIVCGVRLFGVEGADLPLVADRERARTALLPTRVRPMPAVIDNDF